MAQPKTSPEQPPLSESGHNPDPSSPGAAPGSPTAAEPDETLSSPSPTVVGQLEHLNDRILESLQTFIGFDAESWLGPAQNGKRERLSHLLVNGRFIVALLAAGALLLVVGAASSGVTFFGVSLILLALCSISFRMKMVARYAIVATLSVAIFVNMLATFLAVPVYDSGLIALNSFTDPSERSFWPDPTHREIPGYENMPARVFVETGDGVQVVDTTTDAGRDLALWGIKANVGEQLLRTVAEMFAGVGIALACLGIASRLSKLTRTPASISDKPGLFDRIGRLNRITLIVLPVGLASLSIGLGFGNFLDEILDETSYYYPGGGVNQDALAVGFSLMILHYAEYLGYIAVALGIFPFLAGTPRRLLFAWFDRRGLQGGYPWDPILKKTGVVLTAIGILMSVFGFWLRFNFLKVQEFVFATTGNWQLLNEEPEWLRTLLTTLDFWPAPLWGGVALFLVGSKTVRKYVGRTLHLIHVLGSWAGSSTGGSSTPSQSSSSGGTASSGSGGTGSGEVISGGAIRASQAAQGGRMGGGGGR